MSQSEMKVKYINHMGSDLSVVNAAYASFGKQATEFDETKHNKLIQYLARGMSGEDYLELILRTTQAEDCRTTREYLENYRKTPSHFSPFTHTAITLQCKAPIAIHAQVVKHTVGFNVNTVSRRYVSEIPEYYLPTFRAKPTDNIKQGSGDKHPRCQTWQTAYEGAVRFALDRYNQMIDDGVAPEQARFILPQGVMTEWVWTGNLASFARFYNQRTDSHAQKEIQELAHMVSDIISPLFPKSWEALTGVVYKD